MSELGIGHGQLPTYDQSPQPFDRMVGAGIKEERHGMPFILSPAELAERQSRVDMAASDPAIVGISQAVAGEAFDTLGLDEVAVFSERARERLLELGVPPDLIGEVHSTSLINQAMLTEEAAARARLANNG